MKGIGKSEMHDIQKTEDRVSREERGRIKKMSIYLGRLF